MDNLEDGVGDTAGDPVGEGVPDGVTDGCTEPPYGLFPMMRFDTKDHPTHPAHNTAAMTIPAKTFPIRSSTERRCRCAPNSRASRSRRRRTDTDSSNWLS
ncbi:hypothetical protein J8M51_04245 [Streptomyces scabiei]|nr:hypothetical protein [Streptomyces griseiscabiei]